MSDNYILRIINEDTGEVELEEKAEGVVANLVMRGEKTNVKTVIYGVNNNEIVYSIGCTLMSTVEQFASFFKEDGAVIGVLPDEVIQKILLDLIFKDLKNIIAKGDIKELDSNKGMSLDDNLAESLKEIFEKFDEFDE